MCFNFIHASLEDRHGRYGRTIGAELALAEPRDAQGGMGFCSRHYRRHALVNAAVVVGLTAESWERVARMSSDEQADGALSAIWRTGSG